MYITRGGVLSGVEGLVPKLLVAHTNAPHKYNMQFNRTYVGLTGSIGMD
jgi:hypothetical protein